jgi:hypothetical protein
MPSTAAHFSVLPTKSSTTTANTAKRKRPDKYTRIGSVSGAVRSAKPASTDALLLGGGRWRAGDVVGIFVSFIGFVRVLPSQVETSATKEK